VTERNERIDEFKGEIASMKLKTGKAGRERALISLSVVLMLAGAAVAIGAYAASLNVKITPGSNADVLDANSYVTLAIAGLVVSVVGGFMFLRYSLAAFLRYWLLRQSYEQRVAIDEAARRAGQPVVGEQHRVSA
jgi:hypothetical protein